MFRKLGFVCVVIAAALCGRFAAVAAPPAFPALGSAQSVSGELVGADFIHRSGQFRTASGELMSFTMPPYAIMTYQGTESDLRDVPLGTELEFLLLPDDEGRLARLVGTRHGQAPDEAQRKRFVEFTTARGLAGWIDQTAGKTLTVTFFSGNPEAFAATWGDAFAQGKRCERLCRQRRAAHLATHLLRRTWNDHRDPERAGRRLRLERPARGDPSDNMLEGFRQGRVVRVFGFGLEGAEPDLSRVPDQLRLLAPAAA